MATKYERRIEALTSEVALSRTRIQRRMAELEEQLDVSQRVRNELSAHPFKWLALSAAGGFVASKLLPFAFRTSILGHVITCTSGPHRNRCCGTSDSGFDQQTSWFRAPVSARAEDSACLMTRFQFSVVIKMCPHYHTVT